jgi:hypothetical protein
MIENGGNMKKIFILLWCIAFPISFAFAAKAGPGNKFGANYNVINSASYTLTSKTNASQSDTGSESVVGAVLLYENVLSSKFAWGLKYGYQLTRNMEMTVGTTDLNVEEITSYWLLDVKAYQKDHVSGGLKPFLSVGFGNMTVTSTITQGSTTDTTETTAIIPITTLSGGIDYFMDAGGFRLEVGLMTGEKADQESHDDYKANYKLAGSYGNIGVFWLF